MTEIANDIKLRKIQKEDYPTLITLIHEFGAYMHFSDKVETTLPMLENGKDIQYAFCRKDKATG